MWYLIGANIQLVVLYSLDLKYISIVLTTSKFRRKFFFKIIYICTEAWKEITMTNKELYNILFFLYYTLFLYKNLVYKNVEAQIKNIVVNLLVAISISFPASDEI